MAARPRRWSALLFIVRCLQGSWTFRCIMYALGYPLQGEGLSPWGYRGGLHPKGVGCHRQGAGVFIREHRTGPYNLAALQLVLIVLCCHCCFQWLEACECTFAATSAKNIWSALCIFSRELRVSGKVPKCPSSPIVFTNKVNCGENWKKISPRSVLGDLVVDNFLAGVVEPMDWKFKLGWNSSGFLSGRAPRSRGGLVKSTSLLLLSSCRTPHGWPPLLGWPCPPARLTPSACDSDHVTVSYDHMTVVTWWWGALGLYADEAYLFFPDISRFSLVVGLCRRRCWLLFVYRVPSVTIPIGRFCFSRAVQKSRIMTRDDPTLICAFRHHVTVVDSTFQVRWALSAESSSRCVLQGQKPHLKCAESFQNAVFSISLLRNPNESRKPTERGMTVRVPLWAG